MANDEQDRAQTSKNRGKFAAGMVEAGTSKEKVRAYIAEQGNKETKARKINATIGKSAGYSSDPVSFKRGGKVKRGGRARVHKGEEVLTKKQAKRFSKRR
jgi:hypothetical protein